MTDRSTLVQQKRNETLVASGQRLPLKSGLCLAGFHEGSKPKNRDGQGIKTCDNYLVCPCSCHTDMDELFELSGKVREPVTNPLYKPVVTHFNLTPAAAPGLISGESPDEGQFVSPAPGIVPGSIVRNFSETPTGRAARGQLEAFTKQVCDEWVIENVAQAIPIEKQFACTLAYVADRIAEMHGITAPQLGGINSVFQRWREQGIAQIGDKPTRFVAYTADAIEYGIDYMRERAKRNG